MAHNSTPQWVQTSETASTFVLTGEYALMMVYALFCLFGSSHPRTKMIRILCVFIAVGSVFRCLYFGLSNDVLHTPYTPSNTHAYPTGEFVSLLLLSIPNILFYATFCLIVFFWAQAYFSTKRQQAQRRPLQFFMACVLGYTLVQVAMWILFFFISYEHVLMVHSATSCAMALLVAVGFVTFWLKLSHALQGSLDANAGSSFLVLSETGLKSTPAATRVAAARQAKMRKITAVAFAGVACTLFKACLMLYQMRDANADHFPSSYWWLIITLYYTLDEVVTSTAILVVLRKPRDAENVAKLTLSKQGDSEFDRFTSTYESDLDGTLSVYGATDPDPLDDTASYGGYTPSRAIAPLPPNPSMPPPPGNRRSTTGAVVWDSPYFPSPANS